MFEQQHILKENQIVSTFLLKSLDLTVSIIEKIIKKPSDQKGIMTKTKFSSCYLQQINFQTKFYNFYI